MLLVFFLARQEWRFCCVLITTKAREVNRSVWKYRNCMTRGKVNFAVTFETCRYPLKAFRWIKFRRNVYDKMFPFNLSNHMCRACSTHAANFGNFIRYTRWPDASFISEAKQTPSISFSTSNQWYFSDFQMNCQFDWRWSRVCDNIFKQLHASRVKILYILC